VTGHSVDLSAVTTEQCVFVLQYSPVAAQSCLSTGVYETPREITWFTADLYHLRRLWHRWQPQQRHLHPVSRGGEQLYCCNLWKYQIHHITCKFSESLLMLTFRNCVIYKADLFFAHLAELLV